MAKSFFLLFLVAVTVATLSSAMDPEEVKWESLTAQEAADLIRDRPTRCPRGEYYRQCGPYCPTTCETLGKPVACPNVCRTGCFCHSGRVRDDTTGKCVWESDCPVRGSPRYDDRDEDSEDSRR